MILKDLLQVVSYDKPIVLASVNFKGTKVKSFSNNFDGTWECTKEYLDWTVLNVSTTVASYLYIEIL